MKLAVNGKAFARVRRGGVVRVATDIVRSIARERPDYSLDVLVPCADSNPSLPEMPANVRFVEFTSLAYSTGQGRSAWEQILLPRAVRRGGYDVLLNLSNSAPVWRSPRVPQLLLVYDAGFLNREWYSAAYSIYATSVVRRAVRAGARIVTISNSAADDLRAAIPIEGHIEVIYIDADHPPAEIPDVDLPVPFILSLGELNPRKNLVGAMAGFEQFASTADESYHLVVVGAGRSMYRSDPHAGPDSGHGDRVLFSGYVSDAERWAYYRAASALVFPSHAEGFGLPILEALRVGTPVVASDIPVFRELFGDAVEYVNPCSPDDIAAGLARVCHDSDLREERIHRGRAVASGFSWVRSAQRYIEVIDEIAGADK